MEIEGGNHYLIYKDFQKIERWTPENNPVKRKLEYFRQPHYFQQALLTEEEVLKTYKTQILNNIKNRMQWNTLRDGKKEDNCILRLKLPPENVKDQNLPLLILFTPEGAQDTLLLYYGIMREFSNLPEGNMIMTFIFENSCFHQSLTLHEGGYNYISLETLPEQPLDDIARKGIALYQDMITKQTPINPYSSGFMSDKEIIFSPWEIGHYNPENDKKGVVPGVVRDVQGELLVGVNIRIEGEERSGTTTDPDGEFVLETPLDGYLIISYIGFNEMRVPLKRGYEYDLVMQSDNVINEVVVTGMGGQRRRSVTGAITMDEALINLDGKVPGIIARQASGASDENSSNFWIRGISTFQGNEGALIIVDGLPVEDLSQINVEDIVSFSVVKDASATALYGVKAINGVIFIETNKNRINPKKDEEEISNENRNELRRNFHDDAFWQPRLTTDENGQVTFDVTYPDDITSWDAHFIAVGNSRQIDHTKLTVRSFKALTTRLSVPRFAIEGDSLTAFGRIVNQTPELVEVKTTLETVEGIEEKNIEVQKSHTEQFPVKVESMDSVCITYSLERSNGYFDGEERLIPVYPKGVLETKGTFIPLRDSAVHTLSVYEELGKVIIYAETSSLSILEKEIREVLAYPFACNEQTASKVKALVAQKRLYREKGTPFKEDKKMRDLISQLISNQNREGFWGWWNKGNTDFWITKQVLEALLDAEEEGYKVSLNKEAVVKNLQKELDKTLQALKYRTVDLKETDKEKLLDQLLLLYRLNEKADYSRQVEILREFPDHSLTDKFKMMRVRLFAGDKSVQREDIMADAKSTAFGSVYWKQKTDTNTNTRMFLPHRNDMEATLLAYDLLKQLNAADRDLSRVRDYFYECRESGKWLNTYQSSRIIESLLPDLLKEKELPQTSILLNGTKITQFPYTGEYPQTADLTVQKEGPGTLFFTLYQQGWNTVPENLSEGFSVKTAFRNNNDTLAAFLPVGKSIQLDVVVNTSSDKGYVMLEVPIPAGCSYERKGSGNNRYEIHREYFKEKVCIFCNYLPEGEHLFTIQLTPRFNGLYHVNPARAELMYFPTFFGREEIKQIEIKE